MRLHNWEAESHGFRVAGLPSLRYSHIPCKWWYLKAYAMCWVSESWSIPVTLWFEFHGVSTTLNSHTRLCAKEGSGIGLWMLPGVWNTSGVLITGNTSQDPHQSHAKQVANEQLKQPKNSSQNTFLLLHFTLYPLCFIVQPELFIDNTAQYLHDMQLLAFTFVGILFSTVPSTKNAKNPIFDNLHIFF